MLRAEIARPPGDLRGLAGEGDDMLDGAAAGFQHVTGLAGKIPLKHRPDRPVIAMEGGRVEAAVGLHRPAVLAEFYYILRHHGLPPRFRRGLVSADTIPLFRVQRENN